MVLLGGSELVLPPGLEGCSGFSGWMQRAWVTLQDKVISTERRKQMVPLELKNSTVCGDLLSQSDFWLNFPSTTRGSTALSVSCRRWRGHLCRSL